ncbi:Uncharacterized protein APZ42_007466, partial [Daphnia magna]
DFSKQKQMTVTSGPQELRPFRPFSAFKERTCLLRLVRQVRQVRQSLLPARVQIPSREIRTIAIVYATIAVGPERKRGGAQIETGTVEAGSAVEGRLSAALVVAHAATTATAVALAASAATVTVADRRAAIAPVQPSKPDRRTKS